VEQTHGRAILGILAGPDDRTRGDLRRLLRTPDSGLRSMYSGVQWDYVNAVCEAWTGRTLVAAQGREPTGGEQSKKSRLRLWRSPTVERTILEPDSVIKDRDEEWRFEFTC